MKTTVCGDLQIGVPSACTCCDRGCSTELLEGSSQTQRPGRMSSMKLGLLGYSSITRPPEKNHTQTLMPKPTSAKAPATSAGHITHGKAV